MSVASPSPDRTARIERLDARFARIRAWTLHIASGISAEDAGVQSMPDASPTKWHLAHTTWFFEQFLLSRDARYVPYDARWLVLFNSYYQSVGPMHARPQRGLLSRPSFDDVLAYRRAIDERVAARLRDDAEPETSAIVTLGLHHEQQHQELMLTDILHAFSLNPLEPALRAPASRAGDPHAAIPLRFERGRDGVVEIGHGDAGFAFDNETPRHRTLVHPHAIANRAVTNAEYVEFIRDGGYATPTLWMAEGWNVVRERGWNRPLYWSEDLATSFTLSGRRELDPAAPVCHVSFFEADAFARWAGVRLPTEAEWEIAAREVSPEGGHFAESERFEPQPARADGQGIVQLYGDVWEWTSSPYISYPGYRPLPGALGEYNGKFMCGQWVLRGGSCATPAEHIRASYRNFFYPADRWQFMGIRLGRDA